MPTNLSLLELFFELAPLSREDADELKLIGFFLKCKGGCIFLSVLPGLGGMPTNFSSLAFFLRVLFCLGGMLMS